MKTEKTTPSRYRDRADYDPETIYSIFDAATLCTLAYMDQDVPMQIPTIFCRIGNQIMIHGSVGSHMIRTISDGRPVSISVALMDALVLARSVFNHSMNYRSVVMFSKAGIITDPEEKLDMFRLFTEKLIPGRWADVSQPTALEVAKTTVLVFDISEASAKIRTGPPIDDDIYMDQPVWAGIIPLESRWGTPEQDITNGQVPDLPEYLKR